MSTDSKYLNRVTIKCFDLAAELIRAGLLDAGRAMAKVTKVAQAEKTELLRRLGDRKDHTERLKVMDERRRDA